MNPFINGFYLFSIAEYSENWIFSLRFSAGIAIFITGFIINVQSDYILRNLRRENGEGYTVPSGGMFRFVTSPNYLGEILEWTGWAIFTWSVPGLVFMLFTIANLLPRAKAHHDWYKKNFKDYPENRKTLIPFVY